MSHFYVYTAKVICSVMSVGSVRWCVHLCLQTLSLHPRGPFYQLVQPYAPPIRTPIPDSTADLTSQYVGSVTSTSSVLKGPLNKLHVLGKIGIVKITVFLVCGSVCPDDSGGGTKTCRNVSLTVLVFLNCYMCRVLDEFVKNNKCVVGELWMLTLHPHPPPLSSVPPRHCAQSHV